MITFSLFSRGQFDRSLVRTSCAIAARYAGGRDDLCYVDIGANLGSNTIYALDDEHFGSALCFEPDPDNVENLRRTLAANHLDDRVIVHPFGLGAHHGDAAWAHSPDNFGDHHIVGDDWTGDTALRVPVRRLDDVVTDEQIAQMGLISLDVQGYEAQVLLGASRVLEFDIPLVCEITPFMLHQHATEARLHDLLRAHFAWFVDARDPRECRPIEAFEERFKSVKPGGHIDLLFTKRPIASSDLPGRPH